MLKVSLPTDPVLTRAQIEKMVSEFEPGNGGGIAAWDATKPLPHSDAIAGVKGLESEPLEAQEGQPAVEEEPTCNEYVKEFIDDIDHATRLLIGYFEKYLDPESTYPYRIEERVLCAVLHFLSTLNERIDKIFEQL